MNYAVEMALGGMIYIPSFMKIIIGIRVIVSHCLKNLRRYNISTTDGKDLCSRR
jgi:hypothetical protein